MLRWVQMNKSKLFGGRLETYVKPWGHLNKQMESFRYQNSLCDTVDVWDGGCAPIFCLLVTSTTRPLGLASLCDAHPPTLKTMRKKNFARQTSSPFLDPYLVAVRTLKLSNKKIERT